MAFKVIFAIAVFFDLDINQIDVNITFFYGLINQLVYVEMYKGTETEENQKIVCKLWKALYDLKQSPYFWYKRFTAFFFKKLSLKSINADHRVFVIKANLNWLVVNAFVDDIKIMTVKRSEMMKAVKAKLTSTFLMIDINPICFYLGLKMERDREKQTIK